MQFLEKYGKVEKPEISSLQQLKHVSDFVIYCQNQTIILEIAF